jgi:aspartyl aminopeptidase
MHMILKADPNVPSRHDPQHEEYLKQGLVIDKEQVKALGEIPRKEIAT